MEEWLNDTSVDGFLGNLRDYENFIVTDAKWNATLDATELGSITRPSGTVVTDAVGLLNMYEYQSSNNEEIDGYLNNGLYWWTLTPYNSSNVRFGGNNNSVTSAVSSTAYGVRPSINLKSNVKIVSGDGTIDNPYRLNGDNDTDLSGTLLSSRYSGEYIRFGNDENNLYRIVSHENGIGTKITSAEPLKMGSFIVINYGDNTMFSDTMGIGLFLNEENSDFYYLKGFIDSIYIDMIEDNTIWYLGTVGNGANYKLAKYADTNMSNYATSTEAKVGLLRYGELMSGQFDSSSNNSEYWTLTPYNAVNINSVSIFGYSNYKSVLNYSLSVNPSLNLKQNVIITGGDGTKKNPFRLALQ